MDITVNHLNNELVVQMRGLLTFHHHKQGDDLVEALTSALAEKKPKNLRFDMAGVESLDSHWLGIIIRVLKRAKQHSVPLAVENASEEVRRLFAVVQMDKVITIK